MRRLKNMVILGITLVAIGATAVGTGVGALEYRSNTVPLAFQFDTTMTVSLSGENGTTNLLINELSPNTKMNSNAVNITVVTNDVTGYTLKATVGDTANTTTNLVAENGTFGMIGSGESALSAGKWGYTIDNGATFGALALYTATPTTVNASQEPTDETSGKTAFRIGAYASASQAAGDYTNVVNFIAVANSVVTDGTYMQDVTAQSLATMLPNVGDKTTLYDKRDNQAYEVAKLVDGHFWMTQNLRLGKGNGEEIILTSTDSNVSSNFALKASGMGSTSPDATGDCNVGAWYPSITSEYIDKSHLCINTDDNEKYDVYYNWYAATAGTGTYSMTSGNASGSICPKGWILPPNSGDRSYYNLLFTKAGLSYDSIGSTTIQNAPYNFPFSGYTYGEGIFADGSDGYEGGGYFWSSSAHINDNKYAYNLAFTPSYVGPQDIGTKGDGNSVRCVFGS